MFTLLVKNMVRDSSPELPPIIPPKIPEDQDPWEKTVWEISNFDIMLLLLPSTECWSTITDDQVAWIKGSLGITTPCHLAHVEDNLLLFGRPIHDVDQSHPHYGMNETIQVHCGWMTKFIING